jgi:hypothetical protein
MKFVATYIMNLRSISLKTSITFTLMQACWHFYPTRTCSVPANKDKIVLGTMSGFLSSNIRTCDVEDLAIPRSFLVLNAISMSHHSCRLTVESFQLFRRNHCYLLGSVQKRTLKYGSASAICTKTSMPTAVSCYQTSKFFSRMIRNDVSERHHRTTTY